MTVASPTPISKDGIVLHYLVVVWLLIAWMLLDNDPFRGRNDRLVDTVDHVDCRIVVLS